MKRFGLLMLLAALAFPLTACSGGDAEESGAEEGAASATEEGAAAATAAGEEGAAATVAGEETAEKICCGGGCDAPAGMCCNEDGTCGGNHEKLPTWTP